MKKKEYDNIDLTIIKKLKIAIIALKSLTQYTPVLLFYTH